jgi:hypothetical protein
VTTEEAVTAWLLEGDAAICWQVERDLLDQAEPEYTRTRTLVAGTGWGRALLERRDPAGTWGGGLYGPKWVSTTYTLLLLRRCGLRPGHPDASRGVELLWDGARYFDGGLTPAVTIDAPEACVTAMYVALARYFGFDDLRVDVAVDWLLANQLDDGGWNCQTARTGDRHGSFHTSISVLEALAEVAGTDPGQADVAEAMAAGREFFLAHRLYKSHRDGSVVDPVFTKLSFPPRWHYDVLRGLDHFAAVGSPRDDRFCDAIEVVLGRRRQDGTWPVQHKHTGRVWFDMERTGGPSRWNTLRALRVLRWAGPRVPEQGAGESRAADAPCPRRTRVSGG